MQLHLVNEKITSTLDMKVFKNIYETLTIIDLEKMKVNIKNYLKR